MTGWRDLMDELDRWPAGQATFWWRDDDAASPSPALCRLLSLGPQPVAIAVIPARAEPGLARVLDAERIDVIQHGYAHANHEPPPRKKAELGSARPPDLVIDELLRGRQRLEALFGRKSLAVLVPPWNRIAEPVVARLPEAGFAGLSAYRARPKGKTGRLHRVNTHVDILDWRAGARFLGRSAAVALAVSHLAARRRGEVDRQEPTGLLTHHERMDEEAFAFAGELLRRSGQHRAVQWLAARDIFSGGSA